MQHVEWIIHSSFVMHKINLHKKLLIWKLHTKHSACFFCLYIWKLKKNFSACTEKNYIYLNFKCYWNNGYAAPPKLRASQVSSMKQYFQSVSWVIWMIRLEFQSHGVFKLSGTGTETLIGTGTTTTCPGSVVMWKLPHSFIQPICSRSRFRSVCMSHKAI